MCGIDFVIAVTDKEASKAEKFIHINERIHDYLVGEIKNTGKNFDLLLKLDRYGQTIIPTKDVPVLKGICDELFTLFSDCTEMDRRISSFAQELKELCTEAEEQKKHIYAIGD